MKKTFFLLLTLFNIIASVFIPLLGFILLEPSASNLFIISLLFTLSAIGSFAYCDLWIKEIRKSILNTQNK